MADIVHIKVNPLSLSSLKLDLSKEQNCALNLEQRLLRNITDEMDDPYGTARARYEQLDAEISEPEYVPDHPVIINQVLRPLREAKNCYLLGMFVACVSQAGLVGEMVALWRFRMLDPKIDGSDLDERLQKLICGDRFDRLGQQRRVDVLAVTDAHVAHMQ